MLVEGPGLPPVAGTGLPPWVFSSGLSLAGLVGHLQDGLSLRVEVLRLSVQGLVVQLFGKPFQNLADVLQVPESWTLAYRLVLTQVLRIIGEQERSTRVPKLKIKACKMSVNKRSVQAGLVCQYAKAFQA